MPDTPGSGLSGIRCHGQIHYDGDTYDCMCTAYHGSHHGGGSGPCETSFLLLAADHGEGPPRIQCKHQKEEHFEE